MSGTGLECRSLTNRTAPFHAPRNARKARAAPILLVTSKTAQKEGAVWVLYAILLFGAPEFFCPGRGGVSVPKNQTVVN